MQHLSMWSIDFSQFCYMSSEFFKHIFYILVLIGLFRLQKKMYYMAKDLVFFYKYRIYEHDIRYLFALEIFNTVPASIHKYCKNLSEYDIYNLSLCIILISLIENINYILGAFVHYVLCVLQHATYFIIGVFFLFIIIYYIIFTSILISHFN